jgi:hypothetical protein
MTQSTDLYLTDDDKTSNLRNGKLIGIVTAQPKQPLPYTSTAHTAWETSSTWTNGRLEHTQYIRC